MSVILAPQTETTHDVVDVKTRSALATRQFCEALGVGVVGPKNLTYLTVALTEVVAHEIQHNAALRERIRRLYEELVPPATSRTKRSNSNTKVTNGEGSSKASKTTKVSPTDAPDLQLLAQHFSGDDLFAQLRKYDLPSLKKVVALVQEKYPGTKPKTLSKKDDIVAYLLQYGL